MDHGIPLITTLAIAFAMALVFGVIAERMKIPALVGYLIAGILIGPATPGFVADPDITSQLSEIGIMLLMFGVGLHFSLKDLLGVKNIAIPGAFAQMIITTLLVLGLTRFWGWGWSEGLILGLCLACASTIVLIKAFESRGILETQNGRIATGWLIVEDLVTVFILVLLPVFGTIMAQGVDMAKGAILGKIFVQALLGIFIFIGLMFIVGRRALPWLLWQVDQTGSRELFTLSVVVIAIGIAYSAAEFFNVSFALGAFLAGMVMRESEFSHHAAQETLPLRDAFSVLFFVSVGMLFKPMILVEKPGYVLSLLFIIIFGRFLSAFGLILLFRYPLSTALILSAGLAQIGEFSFILAGLAVSLHLLSEEGMNLVLAGALLSIALNPFLFSVLKPFKKWLLKHSAFLSRLELQDDPYRHLSPQIDQRYKDGHIILVGYGKIGRRLQAFLEAYAIPSIVIDMNYDAVNFLRKRGVMALAGNGEDFDLLMEAYIAGASLLVITETKDINLEHLSKRARNLNPVLEIVLCASNASEALLIRRGGFATAFSPEEELSKGLMSHILSRFGLQIF
jgi:CPA2 family monovalent cation:H+ antiporter-2